MNEMTGFNNHVFDTDTDRARETGRCARCDVSKWEVKDGVAPARCMTSDPNLDMRPTLRTAVNLAAERLRDPNLSRIVIAGTLVQALEDDTAVLEAAKARECRVSNGEPMSSERLVEFYTALASLKTFTGIHRVPRMLAAFDDEPCDCETGQNAALIALDDLPRLKYCPWCSRVLPAAKS